MARSTPATGVGDSIGTLLPGKNRKTGIALGDIRTREDFAKLPVLTRDEVNANREHLCSTEFRGKLLSHSTGGSSRTPTSWSGWSPGEKAAYGCREFMSPLAVLEDSPCRCGRGLPRIQRIEGRILDAIRDAHGRTVPGEFFPHVLKDIPEIAQYRVEQDRPDHIVIIAVLHDVLSGRSQALLESETTKVFARKMQWDIRPVPEIPGLASGKQ